MSPAIYKNTKKGLKVIYDPPEDNPNFGEAGASIEHDGNLVARNLWLKRVDMYLDGLQKMAIKELPPGTIYEIRSMIPVNYGYRIGVAWYSNRAMQQKPELPLMPYPGELDELGGFKFMGRMRTPVAL